MALKTIPTRLADLMASTVTEEDLLVGPVLLINGGLPLANAFSRRLEAFGGAKKLGLYQQIYCIEGGIEQAEELEKRGFNVIGHNFLMLSHEQLYSAIIINPPLNDAGDYVERAWKTLIHGKVIALVETIRFENPVLSSEVWLKEVVRGHGDRTDLTKSYFPQLDEEAPAISMLTLNKSSSQFYLDFMKLGLGEDNEPGGNDYSSAETAIAPVDVIKDLCRKYKGTEHLVDELISVVLRLAIRLQGMRIEFGQFYNPLAMLWHTAPDSTDMNARGASSRQALLKEVKKASWDEVFCKSKLYQLADAKTEAEFRKFQEQNSSLAFSAKNIYSIILEMMGKIDYLKERCIMSVFGTLTANAADRKGAKGYRTNSSWKVNKKAILTLWYCDNFCIDWATGRSLDDIDRAMCHVSGKSIESILTIQKALKGKRSALGGEIYNTRIESEFFILKVYKKGTLHLEFKDDKIWEQFNVAVSRIVPSLPDDYTS